MRCKLQVHNCSQHPPHREKLERLILKGTILLTSMSKCSCLSFNVVPNPAQSTRALRSKLIKALLSLLEGRSDKTIHERLRMELSGAQLKENLKEVYTYFANKYKV